ncbi:MAG: oxidoreductase C-terminal domain-containing protein, partial [Acidimicrobiia bacterium]
KLQMAGRAAGAEVTAVVGGTFDERRFVVLYGRAGRLIGAFGMNRPRQIVQSRGLVARRCGWDEALTLAEGWT